MDLTQFLIFFCTGVILYLVIFKKSRGEKFVRQFPGPMMFPLIGNSWYALNQKEWLRIASKLHENFGDRIAMGGGALNGLALLHPDDVGKILSSREVNKSSLYNLSLTDWLGSSIFYAKGKEHGKLRKMSLPAFDYKRVDDIEASLNEKCRTLVNILKRNEEGGAQAMEVSGLFSLCSLDFSIEYFTGKKMDCLSGHGREYAAATHNETQYVSRRGMSPWLWPEMIWRMSPLGRKEKANREYLQDFMEKIVQSRKMELSKRVEKDGEENEKPRVLDLLIEEQAKAEGTIITDKYIRDETNFFIFAGHDTVSSALTFAIFLLAANPEEQVKVQEELDRVLGEDRDRIVSGSDLNQLKYLDCCVKETLRLYPPAPAMLRSFEKDFQLDKEVTIPKEVEVLLAPWATHRLAEFFPEPEKFQPSRFFPENSFGRHPFAYFPFSAGPRSCMGQKIALIMEKTILAHIFRNFTVELASPPEAMVPLGAIIITPQDGLKVKLKSR